MRVTQLPLLVGLSSDLTTEGSYPAWFLVTPLKMTVGLPTVCVSTGPTSELRVTRSPPSPTQDSPANPDTPLLQGQGQGLGEDKKRLKIRAESDVTALIKSNLQNCWPWLGAKDSRVLCPLPNHHTCPSTIIKGIHHSLWTKEQNKEGRTNYWFVFYIVLGWKK